MLAQLDRVVGFEPIGREFESLTRRQNFLKGFLGGPFFFALFRLSTLNGGTHRTQPLEHAYKTLNR